MSEPTAAAAPPPAPSLDELRAQLEAAARAYPALRQGLGAALAALRRAQGETLPTRADRRRGLRP